MGSLKRYIPERGDLVAITFGPKAGKLIAKRRSALMLSLLAHNKSGQAIFTGEHLDIWWHRRRTGEYSGTGQCCGFQYTANL